MPFEPQDLFNIADYFLDDRVREGRGDRVALRTQSQTLTYRQVQSLANRFGNVFRRLGVEPEQRVLIALPDIPEYVGALFGTFKIGAVGVMVNPGLKPEEISYFYDYTRARLAVVHRESLDAFLAARRPGGHLKQILVVGGRSEGLPSFETEAAQVSDAL